MFTFVTGVTGLSQFEKVFPHARTWEKSLKMQKPVTPVTSSDVKVCFLRGFFGVSPRKRYLTHLYTTNKYHAQPILIMKFDPSIPVSKFVNEKTVESLGSVLHPHEFYLAFSMWFCGKPEVPYISEITFCREVKKFVPKKRTRKCVLYVGRKISD